MDTTQTTQYTDLLKNAITDMRKDFKEWIKKAERYSVLIARLPDSLPVEIERAQVGLLGWPIYIICIIHDKAQINQLIQAMNEVGWTVKHTDADYSSYDISFEYAGIADRCIVFQLYPKDATCQLRKIGSQAHERPVYEIVCNEGALEGQKD